MTALVDSYGRIAADLRVSVTDRCNLRCTYCMPEEGLSWSAPADLLTFDEITRVVRIAHGLGVSKVRLTGGEPLMRAQLPELVAQLATLGLDDLSMTTNGTTLSRHAADLAAAGLKRVNVSLDSLDRHRFEQMTRRDRLADVLAGIEDARQAGLTPVKVNCVVIRGVNGTEVTAFAELARSTGSDVRFIEYMPLDADHAWTPLDVVPAKDVLSAIDAMYGLEREVQLGSAPATVYRFKDGAQGSVGVIPSVTEPFCSTCDRLRLTADGQLRTCLFATDEADLRAPLRNGADDAYIANVIIEAVGLKKAGHGIGSSVFMRPTRSMSMIGG